MFTPLGNFHTNVWVAIFHSSFDYLIAIMLIHGPCGTFIIVIHIRLNNLNMWRECMVNVANGEESTE
jgi:hypothetical protein